MRILALLALGALLAAPAVAGSTPSVVASIETVAGTGLQADSGDGGPATEAEISHPRGIAFLRDGSYVFAEPYANRVRRVAPDGTISTAAGTGAAGRGGDGGPAPAARLNFAHGVAALADGGFLIADMLNSEIRRVWPDGHITTVVGTGKAGFSGDGGPASAASIASPRGIATLPDGELLIADSGNSRVRRVWPDGRITTVAGTGVRADAGDGGPATAAAVNRPFSVAPLPDGGFLVAEAYGNTIRRIWPDGHIATVAGTGVAGFVGDGGPATAAELSAPHSVVALAGGGFLVADEANNRVRRVLPNGTIATVAGTGEAAFAGDGGPPELAALNGPKALALLPDGGGFLVGDALNNRIRRVTMDVRAPLILCPLPATLAAPTAKRPRLACTLAEPAALALTLRRNGRIVARASAAAAQGTTRIVLPKPLPPGSYALRLTGRTPDGRTAGLSATVRLTR